MKLPVPWQAALGAELEAPYYRALVAFLARERASKTIYPPEDEVFAALALTPPEAVKVVLLGQDPYHDENQAHGLCFSVRPPTKPPPSLRNMYRELRDDLGVVIPPERGDLTRWATQGVLLLNTVLTVVAHEAASHKKQGWETFTDAVIKAVNDGPRAVVFCLWGTHARKKAKLVDASRHVIVEGAHPSPLSVKQFFGSRPFSKVNDALVGLGHSAIDWSLAE